MQFAILDIAVILVVLLSAILAMVRGFSREILSVGSWLAAAAAALAIVRWDDPFTPIVRTYVDNELIALIVTVAIVFLVVLIIVSIITMRISDFIIDSSVGALDRTLGFIFGAARGVLLFVVVIGMFNWLAPDAQPDWVTKAKSKPILDNLAISLIEVLPEDIEDFVDIGKGLVSEKGEPGSDENDAISDKQRDELDRVIEGEGSNN